MSGITGSCSSLGIYPATPAEFPEIEETLSEWKQQAEDYIKEHGNDSYKKEEINLLLRAKAVKIVVPCIGNMMSMMSKKPSLDSVEQIVLCRGEDGCIEGVMGIRLVINRLFLENLCGNPKNIGLTRLDSIFRKKRIGTDLVQYAKDFCVERDCVNIECTPLKGTRAFYQKMGFRGSSYCMELGAETIRNENRKRFQAVA